MIKTNLTLFWLAVGFYTRLPCPKNQDYTLQPRAVRFLPMMGWIVGGLSGLIFYGAGFLWPTSVALLLALGVGILLTGAFHEDGLADVCDGFGGGWDKQQVLDIMKDSRVGTYGALGLVFALLMKFYTLSAMPVTAVPWVLIAGHSFSRFQPVWLMHSYDYARGPDSKSAGATCSPICNEILFTIITAMLPLFMLPLMCFWAVIPVMIVNECLGYYFYRRIGGYTGDCLGAAQQVAEVVFYLSVLALW